MTKKEFFYSIETLIYIIIGFFVIIPLSYIVPKKNNLIIFIGKQNGKFADNTKYLFLYLHSLKEKGAEHYFITEDKETFQALRSNDLPALFYPGFRSIGVLLRARVVVVDNVTWITHCKYYLLFRSYKVQLWHGVGFKRIRLNEPKYTEKMKNVLINFFFKSAGFFPFYDLMISTSEFYTKNVFDVSFKSGKTLESGYPRNDIFFAKLKNAELGTDTKAADDIRRFKAEGHKIAIYAPTFRDTAGDPLTDRAIDICSISELCRENKIIFIFKLSPDREFRANNTEYENVIFYDRMKDVYPILPLTDIMITDYSSIYMDYLLLNKPVIFFPYDYNKYVQKDRPLQFDYNWITPGPKCFTQKELNGELVKHLVRGEDEYISEREDIAKIAFKYRDGDSSKRIWEHIKTQMSHGRDN